MDCARPCPTTFAGFGTSLLRWRTRSPALLAEHRYGLTGLIVAFTACLVVQLAIIEPPNGVVGVCSADIGCQR